MDSHNGNDLANRGNAQGQSRNKNRIKVYTYSININPGSRNEDDLIIMFPFILANTNDHIAGDDLFVPVYSKLVTVEL